MFDTGVPVLAGQRIDEVFSSAHPAGRSGGLVLFDSGAWRLGVGAVSTAGGGHASATQRLYAEIFQATQGLHLARIWNYVPEINEAGRSGLENYRAFCQGRSLAFAQRHGVGFEKFVPAASAVGCRSSSLTVFFAAGPRAPRHVENPVQMPAYDYPADYGPRSPSFARASVVSGEEGATVFISGTAAIRGHATVGPDDLVAQLACTLENLREISLACGLGTRLGRAGCAVRYFKVYLRRAADQPLVAQTLEAEVLTAGDRVSYLLADICRQPLLIEIEATLFGARA